MLHSISRARGRALVGFCMATATFGVASPAVAETCPTSRFVSAWASAPSDASGSYSNQTLRMIVRPHAAGNTIKVRLSNRFGDGETTITSAKISEVLSGARIKTGTTQQLLFKNKPSVTIEPRGDISSDALDFEIKAPDPATPYKFRAYAIDLYLAGASTPSNLPTRHKNAFTTSYSTKAGTGDQTGVQAANAAIPEPFSATTGSMYFVSGIEVSKPGDWGAVATIGDSLTDGVGADAGTGDGLFRAGGPVPLSDWDTTKVSEDARYPDWLQRRLTAATRKLSVANVGIGGNLVLGDGLFAAAGRSMIHRAIQDIAATEGGVTDVIVLGGGNDLGQPSSEIDRFPRRSDVIRGLGDLYEILHRAGVKVTAVTIHPTGGAVVPTYGDLVMGPDRRAVNKWIRDTSGPHSPPPMGDDGKVHDRRADAYWDLAAAIGDGEVPSYNPAALPIDGIRIRSDLRTYDGIHPNGLGYRTFIDSLSAAQIASLRGQTCTA